MSRAVFPLVSSTGVKLPHTCHHHAVILLLDDQLGVPVTGRLLHVVEEGEDAVLVLSAVPGTVQGRDVSVDTWCTGLGVVVVPRCVT